MIKKLAVIIFALLSISIQAQSLIMEQIEPSWSKELKDFEETAEKGDIQRIYQMMSSGFRNGISFKFFKNELDKCDIKNIEFVTLNFTLYEEVGYGIYRVTYQTDELKVSSTEVIFFKMEDASWKLENFPMTKIFPMSFPSKGLELKDGIYKE